MLHRSIGLLCLATLLSVMGCSSNFSVPSTEQVSIDFSPPTTTNLFPGQTEQFTASVSNSSNSSIIWEVNSIVGGNAQVGTISATGLYTAPAAISATTNVTITAAATANTSANASTTITLVAAPTIAVSPAQATVYPGRTQVFQASVGNASNTAVTWQVGGVTGGNATVGTITSTGLYTAPASVASPQSITVTAVSSAFSGATGRASVTVPPAPTVTLSTTPANVMATKTVQFSAAVSDSSGITWEVDSVAGGNATVGTISSGGLYTAPTVIPSPATVTVTAVSTEDPSVQASQTLTITPLLQIVLTVSPAKNVQPLGSLSLSATSTIPNDTLIWKVNTTTNGNNTLGTITTTGTDTATYQAPATAPAAGFVTLYAYSSTYPAIFGSADITIGAQPPGISVTPGSANVTLANTQPFSATVTPSNLSQAVTWSVQGVQGGNSSVGTICNNSTPPCTGPGLYTAPSVLPSNQTPAGSNTVTITATSALEPNAGTATVTLAIPNSVTVAVNSTDTPSKSTLNQGESEHFAATVTPANVPNVTWSLSTSTTGLTCDPNANPNPCGGITPGANSWNITYTAPTLASSLTSAVIVLTATSTADPSKHGTFSITVSTNPTITITPGTVNASGPETGVSVNLQGTQPFTAQLAHVPAGTSVFWTVGCINADETDTDECPGGVPWNPSGGDIDGDLNGPGTITPASGTDTLSVTYKGPQDIFFDAFPANVCSPAHYDSTTIANSYAFVPLTATLSPGGQSATVCIQVNYH